MGGLIRVVTLDAMGTLVELDAPVRRLVAALAERGIAVEEAAAGRALLAEFAYYRAHHDDAADRPRLHDLRARCAEVMADAFDGALDGLPPDERLAVLLEALRFRAYPEVPGALARLRRRGLRLVVVSNWDVSLHDALAATGLADLVDDVLTSAECGRAKPDPGIFALALERAGAAADEALHVGDSPDVDVEGPRAAGMRAVLLDRDGNAPPVDAPTIRTLDGLPPLLT